VTLANARGASIASRDDDAAPGGSNFGWMFRRRARIAATAPRRLADVMLLLCSGQVLLIYIYHS
jgi:hypothetical protein